MTLFTRSQGWVYTSPFFIQEAEKMVEGQWQRTCQECGHIQPDKKPEGELSSAYCNRKCKECGSEGLDYGSYPTPENWGESR